LRFFYKFISMQEEMIRNKEVFRGCFFTGCLSFIVGTLLLILFVFKDSLLG